MLGCGAIGGTVAAGLVRDGHDVLVCDADPAVVAAITKKANEMLSLIEKSDDFRVIVSTGGESRARAYVAPRNNAGIHLELADSVLLKAAAAMSGR